MNAKIGSYLIKRKKKKYSIPGDEEILLKKRFLGPRGPGLGRGESGRFGALKSDSAHHFFRNACTKSFY
jgi:hypothetical protein